MHGQLRQLALACEFYQQHHRDTMLTHPDPDFVSTVRFGGKGGTLGASSSAQG